MDNIFTQEPASLKRKAVNYSEASYAFVRYRIFVKTDFATIGELDYKEAGLSIIHNYIVFVDSTEGEATAASKNYVAQVKGSPLNVRTDKNRIESPLLGTTWVNVFLWNLDLKENGCLLVVTDPTEKEVRIEIQFYQATSFVRTPKVQTLMKTRMPQMEQLTKKPSFRGVEKLDQIGLPKHLYENGHEGAHIPNSDQSADQIQAIQQYLIFRLTQVCAVSSSIEDDHIHIFDQQKSPICEFSDFSNKKQSMFIQGATQTLQKLRIISEGPETTISLYQSTKDQSLYAIKTYLIPDCPEALTPHKFHCKQQSTQFAMLLREAKCLTTLRGKPNIVNLHKILRTITPSSMPDTIQVQHRSPTQQSRRLSYHLVLEYAEHGALNMYSCGISKLCEDSIKHVASQLLHGMQAMHSQGILHRDIKPSNVLILDKSSSRKPSQGRPKSEKALAKYGNQTNDISVELKVCITDFGLSRKKLVEKRKPISRDSINEETQSNGNLCGTPGYVDPAVLAGSYDYNAQSDIFSFGCLLFNLLTGGKSIIFGSDNSQEILAQNELLDPLDIMWSTPELASASPACLDFLSMLLNLSPSRRPKSAAECLGHPWFEYELSQPLLQSIQNHSLQNSQFVNFASASKYTTAAQNFFKQAPETMQLINFNTVHTPNLNNRQERVHTPPGLIDSTSIIKRRHQQISTNLQSREILATLNKIIIPSDSTDQLKFNFKQNADVFVQSAFSQGLQGSEHQTLTRTNFIGSLQESHVPLMNVPRFRDLDKPQSQERTSVKFESQHKEDTMQIDRQLTFAAVPVLRLRKPLVPSSNEKNNYITFQGDAIQNLQKPEEPIQIREDPLIQQQKIVEATPANVACSLNRRSLLRSGDGEQFKELLLPDEEEDEDEVSCEIELDEHPQCRGLLTKETTILEEDFDESVGSTTDNSQISKQLGMLKRTLTDSLGVQSRLMGLMTVEDVLLQKRNMRTRSGV